MPPSPMGRMTLKRWLVLTSTVTRDPRRPALPVYSTACRGTEPGLATNDRTCRGRAYELSAPLHRRSAVSCAPMNESLDSLRQELAAVDRQLMELVGRRLELASAIGAHKRGRGVSIRDYRQERDVVERARAAATT